MSIFTPSPVTILGALAGRAARKRCRFCIDHESDFQDHNSTKSKRLEAFSGQGEIDGADNEKSRLHASTETCEMDIWS